MTMTDARYQETQDSIELIASIVRNLPDLDAFVERAERSLSVGVFVDPTLHAAASAKLRLVAGVARRLREIQRLVEDAAAAGVVK